MKSFGYCNRLKANNMGILPFGPTLNNSNSFNEFFVLSQQINNFKNHHEKQDFMIPSKLFPISFPIQNHP